MFGVEPPSTPASPLEPLLPLLPLDPLEPLLPLDPLEPLLPLDPLEPLLDPLDPLLLPLDPDDEGGLRAGRPFPSELELLPHPTVTKTPIAVNEATAKNAFRTTTSVDQRAIVPPPAPWTRRAPGGP